MHKFYLSLLFVVVTVFASAQNNFTQLNSPEGGPCLKMLQADNGDLYLLTRGGALYRSADRGENWNELQYTGITFLDFTVVQNRILAIDRQNIYTSLDQGVSFTQTWYFATMSLSNIRALPNNKILLFGNDQSNSNFPLYISADEGINWTLTNSNILSVIPDGAGFQSVFIAPDGKIFVPTFLGEIVSSDEGQTFSVLRSYQYQFSKMAFDASEIYSLTYADFVKSDYQAQNWTDIRNGLPTQYFGGFVATTDAQEIIWLNPQLLSQQVFMSTDHGDHWSQQGVIPNFGEEFFNLYSFQNELFLLGSSGVYASPDKGKSWTKKNVGIHAQEYNDMVLAKSKFFLANEAGLYSKNYTDVNWSQNQLPYVYGDISYNFPLYLKGMAFYNSKNIILYGSNHYHFMDSLANNSWSVLKDNGEAGGTSDVSTVVKHDTVFSAVQMFNEINELLPNSTTWQSITPSWLATNSGINAMVGTPDNHILISYRSSAGSTMLAKVDHNFQLISQIPWNDEIQMKRVGSKIFDLTVGSLLVSNDNGNTWKSNLNSSWDYFSGKLLTDEVGRMFIGGTGQFQMSLDTAKTWTTYSLDNRTNKIVSGITTDSLGYIYVAVNNMGIFKSNFKALKKQTINFTSFSNKNVGDPPFTLKASASSGLPITFISSDTLVAKIADSTVTILSAGPVVIKAVQKGNALYDSTSISIPTVIKVITEDRPVESNIFIYPVPAENDLNVGYPKSSTFKEFVVDVIDTQGRTILGNLKGINNLQLDVSFLTPSLYFLRVSSSEKVDMFKFVKK